VPGLFEQGSPVAGNEAVEAVLDLVARDVAVGQVAKGGDRQYVHQLVLQQVVVAGVEAGENGRVEGAQAARRDVGSDPMAAQEESCQICCQNIRSVLVSGDGSG
jgi:hypothetical protein